MERQVAACHIAGALAGIRHFVRDTGGIGIKTGAISRTELKINRTLESDFFIIFGNILNSFKNAHLNIL